MALTGLLWILDDMAVGTLAGCLDLSLQRKWPMGRLALMDATAQAAEHQDRNGHIPTRKTLLGSLSDGKPVFAHLSVGIEGPAADMLFGHLRLRENKEANLAEHQAMAWASFAKRKAVLVTQDKRAAMTALAELGRERVAHPVDLWLYLLYQECVTPEEFTRLCETSVRKDSGLPGIPLRLRLRMV